MTTASSLTCAVVVTVDSDTATMQHLEAHARYGLSRFPEFHGFLGGALHKSADGTRMVQYLRWQTESDYLACLNDPCWDAVASTRRFLELVSSDAASMDVRVYTVVAEATTRSDA